MLLQAKYPSVRDTLRAGDLIAFGGKGRLSSAIKWFTRSPVSHVGVVFEVYGLRNERRVDLIESTTLDGLSGVQRTHLSERLASYGGNVWWLPLSEASRRKLDFEKFWFFLASQEGKRYDYRAILHLGFDILHLWVNGENFDRLYCSETVEGGWQSGYLLPCWINCSESTPQRTCEWKLYAHNYYQFAGPRTEIPRFNSTSPYQ